jgi:hypothetical protein
MANPCETTLIFLGTQTSVTEAFTFILSCVKSPSEAGGFDTEAGIDFNDILPMPSDLEPSKDEHWGNGEKAALVAEYGEWDWCEWRKANWGTRGNYPVIFHKEPPSISDYGLGCEGLIRFYTAILPPSGIVEALSNRFPGVGILCVYNEPCNEVYGAFGMLAGQFIGRDRVRSDDFPDEEPENLDEAITERLVEIETALAESMTELLKASALSN